MLTFECSAGATSYEVLYERYKQYKHYLSFLSNNACMNRGSTIGKNVNYLMWKYDVRPNIC